MQCLCIPPDHRQVSPGLLIRWTLCRPEDARVSSLTRDIANRGLGYSDANAQLYSVPPYACALGVSE